MGTLLDRQQEDKDHHRQSVLKDREQREDRNEYKGYAGTGISNLS